MENLIFSLNAVLPLVFLIFLGAFLRKINIFDEIFLKKMNIFAFKVLLPILLFNNIYTASVSEEINLKFLVFVVIMAILIIGILLVIVPKYEKSNKNRGVLIQGMYRSNFILFGPALIANISGDEGLAIFSTISAIMVPIYNFAAVVILDLFTDERQNYKKTAMNILTNPFIIGSLLGIIASVLQIKFPSSVDKTIADIAKTATPIALMGLGGEIKLGNIRKNIKNLVLVASTKLFFIPAVATTIGILSGYRGVELCALLCMMAPPTAVSSYTMAQQRDCNYELAGQIVFFTTIISPFSIFLFVLIFKTAGLF